MKYQLPQYVGYTLESNPFAKGRRLLEIWHTQTQSVTMQCIETIAIIKTSSEVIKFLTIGAASFSHAHHLPVQVVMVHNVDR